MSKIGGNFMKKVLSTFLVLIIALTTIMPQTVFAVSAPKKVKISSVTAVSSKSIKIKWKKVSGAKGYVIYQKKSSGSYKKIKTITSGKTTSYTKKKLSNRTKYSYKIRAYKYSGSKKVYGEYSKVKSVYTKCSHKYKNANCTSPKKCKYCGKKAGIALGHNYSSATCTSPQICYRCGKTKGKHLGHKYAGATCYTPKTCVRCKCKSGSALGHKYVDNKCSRCGKVDPDSLPVELSELYLMDSSYYRYRNSRFTDSFGNTYNGAHAFYQSYFCFDGSAKEPHSIFSLNGKYSYFKGSIVATTEPSEDDTYYINIYVDDVLKFSKIGYSKTTGKIDFKVDVKNGQSLKIVVGIEQKHRYNYNDEIALVDAQLTK